MSLDTLDTSRPSVKAVEIHFDDHVIDHPVVPVRWCLSPATTKYMRDNPQKDWALVIIAQKPSTRDAAAGVNTAGNPRHEARLVIEGFSAISNSFGFLTFRAPGLHEVVAYLVSSGDNRHARASFWKSVRKLNNRGSGGYTSNVDILRLNSDDEEVVESLELDSGGRNYANDRLQVEIPAGIFAKPMPKWLVNYLDFYGLGVGEDECASRWRVLAAFTLFPIGVALFVSIAFLVVRIWAFILGVLHFLVGGNPLIPWKTIFSGDIKSPKQDSFWMSSDYRRIPIFKGAAAIFSPLALLVAGILGWLAFAMTDFGVYLAITVVVGLVALFLLAKFSDKLEERSERAALTRRERFVYAQVGQIERYAICGEANKGPRKVVINWSGIKRVVCKPRTA